MSLSDQEQSRRLIAALEAAGVEFVGEPWDSGVCHGAAFKDPDGNGLALHHRYEPYADGTMP